MNRTQTVAVTRGLTWALTAGSLVVFVLLCAVFADGVLAPPLWNNEDWVLSPLITYLMLGAIVVCVWVQARGIPADGVVLRLETNPMTPGQVNDPVGWRLALGNIYFALIWLPLRFVLGREWLSAGSHKLTDPAWMGGGEALKGFWEKAVVVPESGRPPITYDWFRTFLQFMLDHGWYTWFAKLIAGGETAVGLALLLGAFVGLAAVLGPFMNFNYLLAGTAATNPVLFVLGVLLLLAWKVAGFWGLDRWLLPALGAPWDRAKAGVDRVAAQAEREAVAPMRPGP